MRWSARVMAGDWSFSSAGRVLVQPAWPRSRFLKSRRAACSANIRLPGRGSGIGFIGMKGEEKTGEFLIIDMGGTLGWVGETGQLSNPAKRSFLRSFFFEISFPNSSATAED